MTASERKEQGCDLCGQVDTHPRHVTFYPAAQDGVAASADIARKAIANGIGDWGLRDLTDSTRAVRHLDCCANAGCEVCTVTVQHSNGAHGDALTEAVTSPEFQQQLSEKLEAWNGNL